MRALSIRQPWASLIIAGVKNIENRSWTTSYRGPLLIHASTTGTAADMEAGVKLCKKLGLNLPDNFPVGGFIGSVELTGIIWQEGLDLRCDHPTFELKDARGYNGDGYGWIFENPKVIPFRRARGKLGLFIPA
jgi:hypothetical protein